MVFTDGMCFGCTARFRREWHLPEIETRRAAFGLANGLARAAMVVFVAASFTLAARQLDDVRSGGTMTTPPETVLVPSVPSEDEPMPALAIARRPRRARTDASRVARATAPRPTQSAPETIESSASSAEPSPIMASVFDPAPAVIRSASVEVAFAAVPHAGLTHQAP